MPKTGIGWWHTVVPAEADSSAISFKDRSVKAKRVRDSLESYEPFGVDGRGVSSRAAGATTGTEQRGLFLTAYRPGSCLSGLISTGIFSLA